MALHQGLSLHLCDQEQHFEVFTVWRLTRFPPQRAEEREFFSPQLSVSDSLILTILGTGFFSVSMSSPSSPLPPAGSALQYRQSSSGAACGATGLIVA